MSLDHTDSQKSQQTKQLAANPDRVSTWGLEPTTLGSLSTKSARQQLANAGVVWLQSRFGALTHQNCFGF